MRGRHSAAILTHLGVTETIAASPAGYVGLAVRLAHEPAWRAATAARMRAAAPRLFGDRAPLRALEAFLARASRSFQ